MILLKNAKKILKDSRNKRNDQRYRYEKIAGGTMLETKMRVSHKKRRRDVSRLQIISKK